jgi:DNA-binding HxlR family transcriptional regulator
MRLIEMAHARAGDKGSIVTLSVIAYRPEDFSRLEQAVTAERVEQHFREILEGPVLRYELANLSALNFVLRRKQQYSVTRSLALDAHGKCLSSALLEMEL